MEPENAVYLNTLGVILFRNSEWQSAVGMLEKSLELSGDKYFGANGFFLSMSKHHLSQFEEAASWYQQSVEWMDTHAPEDHELNRFKAKAAELLQLEVSE